MLCMRKLPKYACISVMVIVIFTVFSLCSTSMLGASNTNLNMIVAERPLQTAFNPSIDAVSIQTVSASSSQDLPSMTPSPCFGPEIIAYVDKTEVDINQTITVVGRITPPLENANVRICCVRPDYSWIEIYVPTDPKTGEFGPTEIVMDMKGFWNLGVSNVHISDRMFVIVNDPTGTAPDPVPSVYPWKPHPTNVELLGVAVVLVCVGIVFALTALKKKNRRISSLRVCVVMVLICLVYTGAFVDYQNFPRPVRMPAVHELLIGTNVFGVGMPEGFAVPFLACYYPCGRTVTCALWELQTYIYPFIEGSHGWGVYYNTSGVARLAVVIGGLILCALVLGRAWCSWICPFGLYHDLLSYIRKRLRLRRITLSDRTNKSLHQLSFVILATMLIMSAIFASETLIGTQLIPGTQEGGYIYRYLAEPFCTVCPMKPLCVVIENHIGIFQTENVLNPAGSFYHLGRFLTSINVISLIIVSIVALFLSRAWCRICPLGGLVGFFSKVPPFKWLTLVKIDKNREKCTKCGICKRVCPMEIKEVYEQDEGDIMTPRCIGCLHCVEMCPYKDALQFKFAGKTVCSSKDWL